MRLNVKKYIALYDVEDYLFRVIGARAKKREYLTFEEFFNICMWKSNRQKPNYLKNRKTVASLTKKAFKIKDEEEKIKLLCSLSGVGIPTASSLLTIVFPGRYAIIDIRCVSMLRKLGYKINKTISINSWINYIDIMRDLAKVNKITPRQLDMVLFSMHKESLQKDNYQNLYSYGNSQ